MAWKIRADCTYTTAANKTARQNAAQAVLDAHEVDPVAGRFAPGLTSLSTMRFTISVDAADQAVAMALLTDLGPALTASARSSTLFSVHDAGT